MKRQLLFSVSLLAAGALFAADSTPKDDILQAAKKLGQDSYSWQASMEAGNFNGETKGKIDKAGMVQLTMTFGDNTVEAFLQNGKGAVKPQDQDWQSLADLTGGSEPGRMRFLARRLQNYKAPAAELADLAEKSKEIKPAADALAADLTEAGAKDLLTFSGRRGANAPEPKNAKGNIKVWLKDGMPVKYQVHVEGTINFNGEDRDMDRTTTVEIKNVGATTIEVPEAAKKKLS